MIFSQLSFRKANKEDLTTIISLLANDILGQNREGPQSLAAYQKAFDEISQDKNSFLAVVEFEKHVIGTCHLTLMPSLTIQGTKRMNIEAVRVDDKFTDQGIGSWMIKQTLEFAKKNDAQIVQLTTNKKRLDAHRFYKKLGFIASHEGMKINL